MLITDRQVYLGLSFTFLGMYIAYLLNYQCTVGDFDKNILVNIFRICISFSGLFLVLLVLVRELYGRTNIILTIFIEIIFIGSSFAAHWVSEKIDYMEINVHIVFGFILYIIFMLFVRISRKYVQE
jgi:hypothetical protein